MFEEYGNGGVMGVFSESSNQELRDIENIMKEINKYET